MSFVFYEDDFGVGVFGYVLTGFGSVCCVDSYRHVESEDTTEESDIPSGVIESDNVDGSLLVDSEGD